MRNHTATHLLHHALRTVLGQHVLQAGSVVAPERLRFDFTHPNALSAAEVEAVEQQVNLLVLDDHLVQAQGMKYREAVAAGAMALFTEKYGDEVRVIKIGDEGDEFSRELCGGTHVGRTGEIGLFLIVSEESVGAGARRIEAVTGRGAYRLVRERSATQDEAAASLHVPVEQLPRAVRSLQGEVNALQKELGRLRAESARQQTERLASEAVRIGDVAVVAAHVPAGSIDTLRDMSDWLRTQLGSAVVVLSTAVDGKPQVIAAVTDDLVAKGVHAGELVKAVAKTVGGGGGGKPTLAQAGGRDLSRIDEALGQVEGLVRKQLA